MNEDTTHPEADGAPADEPQQAEECRFTLPNGRETTSEEVFAVIVQQDHQIKQLQMAHEDLQKRFNTLFDLYAAQQNKS